MRSVLRLFGVASVLALVVSCGSGDGEENSGDAIIGTDVTMADQHEADNWFPEMDLILPDGNVAPEGPGNQEFAINTTLFEDQMNPAVAALSDDGFVVLWQSGRAPITQAPQDGSGWGVFGRRFLPNAAPESEEFNVNSSIADDQQRPDVSAFADGSFLAVWESSNQDGSLKGVYLQRFANNGTRQGSETIVNTTTNGSQSLPRVDSRNSGDFMVVWQTTGGLDGDAEAVFGQSYATGAVRRGPEFQANTYFEDGQTEPSVAALGDSGNYVIVWGSMGQDNGIGYGVYGQIVDQQGAAVGEEFIVNTEISGQQQNPDVAALPDGGFVVVWQSFPGQDGDGAGVFGQAYTSSGTRSGLEFQVNTFAPGHQTLPRIASFDDGTFLVVWQSCPSGDSASGGDGDGCGIYGQKFDAPAMPSGGIFQANQYNTGNQERPDLATFSNKAFVIVWNSQHEDDPDDLEDYGVRGRYFPPGYTPGQ